MIRSKKPLARVAAALVVSAASMAAAPPAPPPADSVLTSTYKEYVQKGQQARDVAEVRGWIHRFETELARSNPKDEAFYHALAVLGDLYDKAGDRAGSLRVREGILRAPGAPTIVRVQAGMAAIFLKDRDGKDPAGLLAMSGEVERLFEAGTLGASREAFRDEIPILHFKEVQWTIAVAQERWKAPRAESLKAGEEEAFRASLTRADAGLARFLDEWAGLPEDVKGRLRALNYGTEAAMYLRGEVEFTLANADMASGHKDDAAREFAAAKAQLTELLRVSPKDPRYSQPAAVLLLQIKEREGADTPEYLEYIKALLPKVAAGHTVINHLSDISMSLASGKTRRAASRLFDLVVDREKAWFPDEYRRHINYQVALLESTANDIGMDDLKAAGRRLALLKSIEITDPYLRRRLHDVSRIYGRKFAGGAPASPAPRRFVVLYANLALLAVVAIIVVAARYRRLRGVPAN